MTAAPRTSAGPSSWPAWRVSRGGTWSGSPWPTSPSGPSGPARRPPPRWPEAVHTYLRGIAAGLFDEDAAQALRILYGGSVKPANAAELMAVPDIDGALVGGASLRPDTFLPIIDAAS